MKNIGGSILPSSCPEILRPLVFGDQTRAVLASHPNGYSCHELAKRMVASDKPRALEQAAYIVACGGELSALGASMVLSVRDK